MEWEEGQRLWVWLPAEPCPMEFHLSQSLKNSFPNAETFYIEAFSWVGDFSSLKYFIDNHLPKENRFPKDAFISFYTVTDEETIEIPKGSFTFTHETQAGSVQLSPQKYQLKNQTVIIIACKLEDSISTQNYLGGLQGFIGLLTLLLGDLLPDRPIFSTFFSIAKKKFLYGDLILSRRSRSESDYLSIKDLYDLNHFDAENDTIYSCLWFTGKAHTAKDRASKVIFYNTALEVIANQNIQNYYRKVYHKHKDIKDLALEQIRNLQKQRGDILHQGKHGEMTGQQEHSIQTILLDGIIFHIYNTLQNSAYKRLKEKGLNNPAI